MSDGTGVDEERGGGDCERRPRAQAARLGGQGRGLRLCYAERALSEVWRASLSSDACGRGADGESEDVQARAAAGV